MVWVAYGLVCLLGAGCDSGCVEGRVCDGTAALVLKVLERGKGRDSGRRRLVVRARQAVLHAQLDVGVRGVAAVRAGARQWKVREEINERPT